MNDDAREFVLKTGTERVLYVEALLQCLEKALISAEDACRDLACLFSLKPGEPPADTTGQTLGRVAAVITAFAAAMIDRTAARSALLDLFDHLAATTMPA